MSEFINTIDSLGDEITLGKLIDGSLTEIKDDILTKVKKYLFYFASSLTTVDLPNVTSVGKFAFSDASNLTSVNFPNVKQTDDYAFQKCTNLTTVNLPSLETLGSNSFNGCSRLTSINLLNALTIGNGAFRGCSKLTSMDLPKVTSIRSNAFAYCSSLEALILRSETLCALSNTNAFTSTPISSGTGYIYVPRALIDSYKSATNWSTYASQFRALEDYTVDGTTTGELDENKVNPSQTRALLDGSIELFSNENITNVKIYAFQNCSNLTSVDLPLATSIGTNAFYSCSSLTSLILRSETLCTLSDTSAFSSTPIKSGTGYIYVPSALIDSYKTATNWSTYANQFRVLEDYPEICGGEA